MNAIRNQIEVNPRELVITNEDVDMKVVHDMVAGLLAGTIKPEDLTVPYITFVDGQGWCVNDGNHTVRALQLAGISSIKADTY